MRINKGFFFGVLIGFVVECCVEQILTQRFMSSPEESSPGAAWAFVPIFKSHVLDSLNHSISADIAAGNYKKPYEYLCSRREAWSIDNTLAFVCRGIRFPDGDRREFLDIYLKKLREAGYNDWIGEIHVREREDYYNAILARVRCLYIILETLHAQGKDDVFFSQVWREFVFLSRRLDNLLGVPYNLFYGVLELSEKEQMSLQSEPMTLPVPEILPTWTEKMTF